MGVDRVLRVMDSPDFQEKAGLGVSAASGLAATASLWNTLGLLAFLPGMGAGMAGAVATAVVLNAPYAIGRKAEEVRLAALQRAKDAAVVPGFPPVGRDGDAPSTAPGARFGIDAAVRAASERGGPGPGPESRQRGPLPAARRKAGR